MGEVSCAVRGPADRAAPFDVVEEGCWVADVHLEPLREALRMASKWVRKEWRPDFGRELPFGEQRGVMVRRCGGGTLIVGVRPDGAAPSGVHAIELTYVELPGVRGAIDRAVQQVRRRAARAASQSGGHDE